MLQRLVVPEKVKVLLLFDMLRLNIKQSRMTIPHRSHVSYYTHHTHQFYGQVELLYCYEETLGYSFLSNQTVYQIRADLISGVRCSKQLSN